MESKPRNTPPVKKAPVAEPAAESAAKRRRTSPNFPPESEVTLLTKNNPKREGSKSFDRYENYAVAGTVGEYIAAGGTYADLKYDAEHGFVSVEGFDAVIVKRKVREPKAPKAEEAPAAAKPVPVQRKVKVTVKVTVEAEED